MFDVVYTVEIYFNNKLIRRLVFGDEGLARTYVEGALEAQYILGRSDLKYEIVAESLS